MDQTTTFICTGDWGAKTRAYYSNKKSLEKQALIDFFVLLGDNFYPSGVSSVHDGQWKDLYEDTFSPKIPSFAVLGNHDYLRSPEAQVMYTYQSSSWKMPFFYYDMTVRLHREDIHFIFIDTCLLAEDITTPLLMGNTAAIDAYRELVASYKNKQKAWLEDTLRASTSRWKVVCGHYPVISDGPHTTSAELRAYLLPLFEHFGVDFYLSGHDHNLQHRSLNGVNHVVCGAFASSYPLTRAHPSVHPGERFSPAQAVVGFARFTFSDHRCSMDFVSENNRLIYSFITNKS
jgi:acid phosphatase